MVHFEILEGIKSGEIIHTDIFDFISLCFTRNPLDGVTSPSGKNKQQLWNNPGTLDFWWN